MQTSSVLLTADQYKYLKEGGICYIRAEDDGYEIQNIEILPEISLLLNTLKESIQIQDLKSTGIIRKVDDAGRVSPPVEQTKRLRINPGDPLTFIYDKDSDTIWIQKLKQNRCINCDATEDLETILSKQLCKKCKERMVHTL